MGHLQRQLEQQAQEQQRVLNMLRQQQRHETVFGAQMPGVVSADVRQLGHAGVFGHVQGPVQSRAAGMPGSVLDQALQSLGHLMTQMGPLQAQQVQNVMTSLQGLTAVNLGRGPEGSGEPSSFNQC